MSNGSRTVQNLSTAELNIEFALGMVTSNLGVDLGAILSGLHEERTLFPEPLCPIDQDTKTWIESQVMERASDHWQMFRERYRRELESIKLAHDGDIEEIERENRRIRDDLQTAEMKITRLESRARDCGKCRGNGW